MRFSGLDFRAMSIVFILATSTLPGINCTGTSSNINVSRTASMYTPGATRRTPLQTRSNGPSMQRQNITTSLSEPARTQVIIGVTSSLESLILNIPQANLTAKASTTSSPSKLELDANPTPSSQPTSTSRDVTRPLLQTEISHFLLPNGSLSHLALEYMHLLNICNISVLDDCTLRKGEEEHRAVEWKQDTETNLSQLSSDPVDLRKASLKRRPFDIMEDFVYNLPSSFLSWIAGFAVAVAFYKKQMRPQEAHTHNSMEDYGNEIATKLKLWRESHCKATPTGWRRALDIFFHWYVNLSGCHCYNHPWKVQISSCLCIAR